MKKQFFFLLLLLISTTTIYAEENIALKKSITVSTGSSPQNINDGNLTSRWESTHGLNDQWVMIDLAEIYDLTSTNIHWEAASAASYAILVSGNKTDWNEIATHTSTTGKRTDELDLIATAPSTEVLKQVRYLKLDLKTRTTVYGFSIYEWEIYGTLSAAVAPIPSAFEVFPGNATLLTGLPETIQLLSINNSLIDYNDQPGYLTELAAKNGVTLSWHKRTMLGQSLLTHYNDNSEESAKNRIRSTPWTHIILQEQSNTPRTNPAEFLESVKLWAEYIKENCPNPNARIILPINWAYTDSEDFYGDATALYASYKQVEKEVGVLISPVGEAYKLIYEKDGLEAKNKLYTDNRHPSVLASYLAACSLYGTLFNTSSENLDYYPSSITAQDAARMQTRAWEAYKAHDRVINDVEKTVKYSSLFLDQFNRPIENNEIPVEWSVNDGGTIENGVFISNGTTGEYTVTAKCSDIIKTVQLTVAEASSTPIEDTYYVTLNGNGSYEQNFNEIGTEATATLPLGWKIDKNLSAPHTVGVYDFAATKTEQAGGSDLASTAKNGIYNFGASLTTTDRAIGGISTGIANGTRGINIYLKTMNQSDLPIESLSIEYDVEKYRMGSNSSGFCMQMYYSKDGKNWTSAGDSFYTFFPKDDTTLGYSSAPGEARNIKADLQLEITPGEVFFLAWNYSVAAGTDAQAAQALALDNVTITVNDGVGIHPDMESEQFQLSIQTNGTVNINTPQPTLIKVYSIDGKFINGFLSKTGENQIDNLSKGVYIINNRKVVIC